MHRKPLTALTIITATGLLFTLTGIDSQVHAKSRGRTSFTSRSNGRTSNGGFRNVMSKSLSRNIRSNSRNSGQLVQKFAKSANTRTRNKVSSGFQRLANEIRKSKTSNVIGQPAIKQGLFRNSAPGEQKLKEVVTKFSKHLQHAHAHHKPSGAWCGTKPRHCWWWFDYCQKLRHCRPADYHYCDWNYVRCEYNTRWYLGIKGMILPGKGLGVEQVAQGSPAELAGFIPGYVIARVNGVDLVDEQALANVMSRSNGILEMTVVDGQTGATAVVTVRMTRVVEVSY